VQAQILNLLKDLRERRGLALVLISMTSGDPLRDEADLCHVLRSHRGKRRYRIGVRHPTHHTPRRSLHPFPRTAGTCSPSATLNRGLQFRAALPAMSAECCATIPPLEATDDGRRVACFHPIVDDNDASLSGQRRDACVMISKIDAPRPTIDDWLTGQSCVGFQHAREIVPSARIRRAAKPRPLSENLRALDDVPVLSGGVTLEDYLRRSASGFLVLHRGTICYERYLNGLTPHTPHLLMSVSKSIAASVTGALIHAGALSPDDNVCTLLPELRDPLGRLHGPSPA